MTTTIARPVRVAIGAGPAAGALAVAGPVVTSWSRARLGSQPQKLAVSITNR
jgi:hypothetical protein